MNLTGRDVTLHDMSLRDGMHAKRHQITLDQMVDVATGLDDAGIPLIEVTPGTREATRTTSSSNRALATLSSA